METAESYLKLDLARAKSRIFSGTTGKAQIAKLAHVLMIVLDEEMNKVWEIRATCGFCDTLEMAGGALLGQNGFFSFFKTTFYQPERRFAIEQWPIV